MYPISYDCSHRYITARHTVISCSHITVTYAHRMGVHACIVSIFLSYGLPCILHVLLFHVTVFVLYDWWIPVHTTCIIVPCYRIHVIWLFPVTDMDIPVTGHESCWYAICGIPHLLFPFPVIWFPLYCSRFPLYCSTLSTELWSSYHVTCIMYSSCSCHIVDWTYQIIMRTWVWGRLDGWLDLIGWCTGSILLVPLQGTVVLPTTSSMSSRYLIRAPLLAEGPGLSSQGSV